jgi:hypothetical protein
MSSRNFRHEYKATLFLILFVLAINFPWAGATAKTLGVVYPPWWSKAQIWQAAVSTGDIVDIGGAPFVLYLHSDAPGLDTRARTAGAFLVFDPRGFGGCGASARRPFS